MKYLYLLSSIVCFVSLSHAQIVTDRPDQTEASLVVPKGALQIEAGMLTEHAENNGLNTILDVHPTLLFRYGISEKLELRLVSNYESTRVSGSDAKSDGIGDLELGFKWNIKGQTSGKTQIAFMSHFIVPTGSPASDLDWGIVNKFAFSQDLADDLSYGINIGYDYNQIEGINSKGNLTYSLAIGHGLNDKVGIFIEPYGALLELEEFVFNIDAGITYLLKPNLQFDFSLGTGVTHNMNFLSAGFSWLILKN